MNNPLNRTDYFSIGDLSKEFGITTRTIRHYEDIGLLSPRREGQSRLYSPADRTRLKLILRGKRLGFSLEESREIIEMYDPSQGNKAQLRKLISSIQQQRQKLELQQQDINTMLRELEQSEAACLAALEREVASSQ